MSGFKIDATGIKPTNFTVVPKGKYHVAISEVEEKTSGNGDPMVKIKCLVDDQMYGGCFVWHNITFLPIEKKGAGMAIHFLKTIGEPFEGQITVDPDNWVGKRFQADVIVEIYKEKPQNKVIGIYPVGDGRLTEPTIKKKQNDQDVPF